MAEAENNPITGREIREAELQMTGRPAVATGFIGFVPAVPTSEKPHENAPPNSSGEPPKE
jgi:hypothetical protein